MKISQAEARRLKRRVRELENTLERQHSAWACDWPGGVSILNMTDNSDIALTVVKTARMLGHAVVVMRDGSTLRFYALPLAKVPK